MRPGQEAHEDERNRTVSVETGEAAFGATAGESAETTFETLFACSPLTHHIALTLQSSGVNASIETGTAGHQEVTIKIPPGDKEAAIAIVLEALSQTGHGQSEGNPPARGLAA